MQQGWAQCSKARGCGVTPRPKTHTGSMHQLQGTTGTVCLAVLLQLSLPTGAAHISLPSQGAPWSIWAATKLQIGVMHVEGGGTCAPVPLCGESLVASLGKGGRGHCWEAGNGGATWLVRFTPPTTGPAVFQQFPWLDTQHQAQTGWG